jgi:DNA modification methylase
LPGSTAGQRAQQSTKYLERKIMNTQVFATHIEQWPIDRLIPYARNARTHSDAQIAQLAASIREFGFVVPILVDAGGGIIAGHGRQLAARKLGMAEVPVILLEHLSENQKRAFILADNRLAEAAGWDEEMLRLEIAALAEAEFDLNLTGFEEEQLRQFLETQDENTGHTDEDSAPEVPEQPISRSGDLWIMGDHRLFCGDSTASDAVDHLMGNDRADLVFTDPPYNVDYEGYTEECLKIQGDRLSADDFRIFLCDTFVSYRRLVKSGASLYVCHSSSSQGDFQNAMEAAGFQVRCQIIWAKNTFAWGFGRYKFQHEPIFYAHIAGEKDNWYGDKSQSTLWSEDKPAANRLHPTMKPVELIDRALVNSSRQADIVADLFGGSGSTLIACQRRARKARLMEIDPRYCDVIVRRWQEYTGAEAVLESSGQSFAQIASGRRSASERAEGAGGEQI